MSKNRPDINNEFIVCRYSNGIKLARPDLLRNDSSSMKNNIARMFDSTLLFYFFDFNNVFCRINSATANFDGFDSENSAIGKKMATVFKKSQADQVNLNNELIMKSGSMKILEERIFRKDELHFHTISFKFPWYNDDDKIAGIFGCSFVINVQSIVDALTQLINFGFLNTEISHHIPHLSNFKNMNVILSKRENEILYLLTKVVSSKNVAKKLGLSNRTVEHYIENIKEKLNVSSKTDLIIKANEYFDNSK